MNLFSTGAFLARCASVNHSSGLEEGEIFVAEPTQSSTFQGKSLDGKLFNGIFEKNDLKKISLPIGRFLVATGEHENVQPGYLPFMKHALLSLEEVVSDELLKGHVAMDSGKKLGREGLFPANMVRELPTLSGQQSTGGEVLQDIEAKMEGELSLSKGEYVQILETGNNWCRVRSSLGKEGLCPTAFLKLFDATDYVQADVNLEPYGTALYEFSAEYDSEMSFIAGDVIKLFRWINSEWLEGENQRTGVTGMFPASFVQVVIAPPAAIEQHLSVDNEGKEPATIGIATVLYEFQARYQDELTVQPGCSLKLLDIQGQWAMCWNPDTDETGIVPQDYLRTFGDCDDVSGSESKGSSVAISNFSDSAVEGNMGGYYENTVIEKPWTTFETDSAPNTIRHSLSSGHLSNPLPETSIDLYSSKTPPARPPPPSLSSISKQNSEKVRKPVQPIQRTAPSRPKSMMKITSSASEDSEDRTSDDWEVRRAKVLEEIIQSESAYLFELIAWESAIERNENLTESKKKLILNGYNMLKYLSRGLTASLVTEQAKSVYDQSIGLRFMMLKEVFYKTYGQYFRSAEQLSEIIVKGDEQIQTALQQSLNDLRQRGSNIFDVPTALSRPIQRCLRYPLYLAEIVKNTPLTHPDHPKLMEALRQMGDLATKMNESKRRKEMAKKYSRSAIEQRETGFFNKLARLNLHSFAKKRNRLQYRITAKMRISTTYRDDEFESLLKILADVQQRFCHLIYQMTVYKNRILRLAKKYVEVNTMNKLPNNFDLSMKFEYNALLKRLISYAEELGVEVIELGNSAHELARRDFACVVHKRYDKLADWEMAIRAKKPSDFIEMRKCEFEALNNQLKLVLPKETDKIIDGLRRYVRRIKHIDNAFFRRVKAWLREFEHDVAPPDFLQFVDPRNLRLRQIEATLFSRNTKVAARFAERRDERKERHSLTEPNTQLPLINEPPLYGRPQTAEERARLIKMCRALGFHDSLYCISIDYASEDGKYVLRRGDIVRERSKCGTESVIENGIASFTVLSKFLVKVKDPFSPALATSTLVDSSDSDPEQVEQRRRANIAKPRTTSQGPVEVTKPKQAKERESVNWLQYDDKIFDNNQMEDYNRPIPAPIESRKTWTTFDNNAAAPQAILQPQDVFGSLHNPVPMVAMKRGEESAVGQAGASVPTRRAPPPPPPTFAASPLNPFSQGEVSLKPSPNHAITANRHSCPPFTDPLDNLVRSEIEKTRHVASNQPPTLPPAPTAPPPKRPNFEANKPLPMVYDTIPGDISHPSYDAPPRQPDLTAPLAPPHLPPPSDNSDRTAALNLLVNKTAVSQFDFSPVGDSEVQLKIREGDFLRIIKPYDDAHNSEWWLVQNQSGNIGYVPSTYLIPNS